MFSQRTDWHLTPNRYTEATARFRAEAATLLTSPPPTPPASTFPTTMPPSSSRYPPPMHSAINPSQRAFSAPARPSPPTTSPSLQRYPERILLTTSTSEAYSFVFRLLCDPGRRKFSSPPPVILCSNSWPICKM